MNKLRKTLNYLWLHGWKYKAVERQHKRLEEQLKGRKQLNVVFMALDVALWRYQSVYELMVADERFNPTVVLTPCMVRDAESDLRGLRKFFDERNIPYIVNLPDHNPHPGFGEDDDLNRSSKSRREHKDKALPEGTQLTFALAGQQNCGKTTLFNQLTGSRQHVGNFPGVTVDRKDGIIIGHDETAVTDLPGIYSLSTYTDEELVSRQFILEQQPKAIINIVDAGNIERNLYLTMQLMELDIPMVLALNMMDEMRNNGGSVRVNEMERILGIPVLPISAAKNEGIDELVDHALHVAKYQERPLRQDFCDKEDHGGAVHRCLHGIMHLIEDHAAAANIPLRFAATKVVEGDLKVLDALKLDSKELDTIESIIEEMEQSRGLDRAAAIADMRFSFIRRLCRQTVVKPRESKEYLRSRQIDKVLTGRWTALPIFVVVMAAVIYLSIELLGGPLQGLLELFFEWLGVASANAMTRWGVSDVVQSLVPWQVLYPSSSCFSSSSVCWKTVAIWRA